MIALYTLLLLVALVLQGTALGAEISAVRTNSATDIVPLWTCWFNTYPPPLLTVRNLLFSYNNTQDFGIAVPDSVENNFSPVQFNGYQPFYFKPGFNLYAVHLADTRNVLASSPTNSIVWTLGGQTVAVDQSMLVEAERCDVKYPSLCPTWIAGFCDDTVYCNGQEFCFSAVPQYRRLISHVMGLCKPAAQGVTCSVSQVCNETARACVLSAPPPPPPPTVVPLLTCWSYASSSSSSSSSASGIDAAGPMHISLVLGYNNTGLAPVVRGVTLGMDSGNPAINNVLQPSVYNAQQPTVFSVGLVPQAFTLIDTLDVLRQGSVTWTLTDQTLVVNNAQLTDDRLCPGARAPTGTTLAPPSGTPTSLHQPAPPVGVITISPALPRNSTAGNGTAGNNTAGNEPLADDEVLVPQCSIANTDCSAYDSFCGGPTQCDLASGYCVLVDPAYTPCDATAMMPRPGVGTVVQCVENTGQCIASVPSCYSDRDCNDGFICNGMERCIDNACVSQLNQTVLAICQYANAICIEGVGCMAIDQMDGRTIYVITFGAVVALALISFFLYVSGADDAVALTPKSD